MAYCCVIVAIANSGSVLRDHVQHGWMSVGELAMTPRISLVAVCCSNASFSLGTVHVFDGDYRLIGECFEQLDLRRGEGAHLDPTRVQRSNEFALLMKRNG